MSRVKLNFKIKDLDKNDTVFMENILYEAIYVREGQEKPPKEIIYIPQLYKYISNWTYNDIGYMAINEINNEKIGAVWLKLFNEKCPGYGYIKDGIPELSIAIFPEYRGLGVGTKLLHKILKESQHMYPQISLSVDRDNKAIDMYKKLGFQEYDRKEHTITMLLER